MSGRFNFILPGYLLNGKISPKLIMRLRKLEIKLSVHFIIETVRNVLKYYCECFWGCLKLSNGIKNLVS